ncbi:hypothetical protein LJR219_002476 [Phenylobacterium sp. LjRoot219]|uniref:hypothetical protein n=1 Tax=Phenylobacterium sp. LjRoot219 TaxID=3342283 RepID=UPI003ECE6E06
MSAFQAYAGAYEFDGGAYAWRCYATARIHEIRRREHGPPPPPPTGRKWVAPARQGPDCSNGQDVSCLVDEAVDEFSQILLQVQPQARAARRDAEAASA